MTKREFLKMCGLLGVGLPVQTHLSSCQNDPDQVDTNQKVIIIGAGAGGLTTGYLLAKRGIDFQILEASSVIGGRMKRTNDFTDFPIPLGAEWLHVERGVFDEIVDDSSIQVNVQTTPYNLETDFGLFNGEMISVQDVGFTIDQKFINSSWMDFFEEYVVPQVQSKIVFNAVVESVDYSGDQINIQTSDNTYIADKVVVSVPVKMLQNKAIDFTPELPIEKSEALSDLKVWDGFKAFISFSEKFYPTFTAYDITPESAGQKLYYDAAYGQSTSDNILGLFTVGTGTLPYRELSDQDLIDYMLAELDELYENRASASYIKHISQNWNREPFIEGAYITDEEDWTKVRALGRSVDSKVFFAGTAYTTGEDWSSVHTAARSAIRAVEEITG